MDEPKPTPNAIIEAMVRETHYHYLTFVEYITKQVEADNKADALEKLRMLEGILRESVYGKS